ncbi:hypothetical protein A0H81_01588 [Grifola frondosa]|uniref:Uncharacterized protein n=1 Tax=Grifola frondosa TaxID=5627 RepID=A0A1C7MLY5_GRIFR|nr:hypothetical protein A0H81_01588 [Grifola frondosa]
MNVCGFYVYYDISSLISAQMDVLKVLDRVAEHGDRAQRYVHAINILYTNTGSSNIHPTNAPHTVKQESALLRTFPSLRIRSWTTLTRLLYRHGLGKGKPFGSMDGACMMSREELPRPWKGSDMIMYCFIHNGSVPHTLFYDLTGHNGSYLHKCSAEDSLSAGSLITFSFSAIGSVKGFDDLYPKLLNPAGEKRKYEVTKLGEHSDIAKAK